MIQGRTVGFILLILLLAALLLGTYHQRRQALRKAFLDHEQKDGMGKQYPQYADMRWENYQKHAKNCPQLAEVTNVYIDRTQDTDTYVITLHGADGKICSLWINGAGEKKHLEVRDLSDY